MSCVMQNSKLWSWNYHEQFSTICFARRWIWVRGSWPVFRYASFSIFIWMGLGIKLETNWLRLSGAILKFEVRAFVGECDKIVYGGNSCASVCVNGDNGKAAIEYALRAKKITAPYLLSPSYNEETCTHRYGSSYGYFISDKCTKVADSASFKVAATQVSIHTNSSTCQGVAQKLPLNNCTSNPESSDFIKFGYQQERLAISLASSNTFALAQLVGSVAFASIVGFLGWL